jgi:hypothetical protein
MTGVTRSLHRRLLALNITGTLMRRGMMTIDAPKRLIA